MQSFFMVSYFSKNNQIMMIIVTILFMEIFRIFITPSVENWTIKNVHFGNFIDSFFEEMERF